MSKIESISANNEIDHHNGLLWEITDKELVTGKPLHEIFKHDTHEEPKTKKNEGSYLQSWLPSWLPFFNNTTIDSPAGTQAIENTKMTAARQSRLIHPTPVLEKPEDFDEDEKEVVISPFNNTNNKDLSPKVSNKKMMEGLSLMNSMTMEQVMAIVLKEQLEIEKNRAVTVQDGFMKLHDLQKLHRNTIEKVKDALMKDEKVAGYFQTGATITKFASFVCGIAALVIATGVTLPAAVAYAATVGTYVTAGFTAAIIGGQSYTETKLKKNKSVLTQSTHDQKRNQDQISDHSEKITTVADSNAQYQEYLISLLKIRERMGKAILQA